MHSGRDYTYYRYGFAQIDGLPTGIARQMGRHSGACVSERVGADTATRTEDKCFPVRFTSPKIFCRSCVGASGCCSCHSRSSRRQPRSIRGYLPNIFRSDTLILVVPQRVPESYVRSTVTTRIEDRLQSISQQILSRTRLERIIQDFNLYADERRTGIMEDIVEQMRKDISIQVVKGDAFRVSYIGREPADGHAGDRTARVAVHRREPARPRGAGRRHEPVPRGAARRRAAPARSKHEKKLEEYRKQYAGQLPSQLESNLQVVAEHRRCRFRRSSSR